jgi:hypothetical protein
MNVGPGGEFVAAPLTTERQFSSLDRGACAPTYRVCEGLVAIASQQGPCLRKVCPQTGQGIIDDRTTHQSSIGGYPRGRRGRRLFASNGADEAGTLAALKRHREAVFDPAVAAHNGRA